MLVKINCYPPLGKPTVVPKNVGSIGVTVLIESLRPLEESFEVALWHNHAGSEQWAELSLQRTAGGTLLSTRSDTRHQWFHVELVGRPQHSSAISFTIKFRTGPQDPWKWANDLYPGKDGQLYYQAEGDIKRSLSHYIEGLSSTLQVTEESSEVPDTLLWSVTAPIEAAVGKTSGHTSHKLGKPTNFSRWFSLVRLWCPWLAPRHGEEVFRPDKDAVLSAFLRRDGLHVVMLAVSGIEDMLSVLGHDGQGNVLVTGRNDRETEGSSRVLVAVGPSFEVANAAVMYHARHIVTRYEASAGQSSAEEDALQTSDQNTKWLQEWYDGLTYCTWNGLGQKLTAERIYRALDTLDENGIKLTGLIIDDNWQSLDHEGKGQFMRGWLEFEADKTAFPEGLKETILKIRNKHKNIAHVAVWHAILGYWGGISPDGKIAAEYKTREVKKKSCFAAGDLRVVDDVDVPRLYRDFYSFLASAGIDSVKTDAQFFLDDIDDADDRRKLISLYQDAWTVNHLRFFGGKAISCMSQTPQILFHSQLPTNKPRLLVRNTDDFFPDVPASHPWHVFCNAYNSLLTQHLNVLPDWDMFQTSHPWASFHAAARCVSGGPIYITDEPGKHDISLIQQMTAQTPRGNTVILRPHVVGKSMEAYYGYEEQALLKVGTYHGMQHTGTGILGIFNACQADVTELVPLDRFPGTEHGEYVVRAHTTGLISEPMSRTSRHALIPVSLPIQGWEIFSAYPLQSLKLGRTHSKASSDVISIANLGLLGKMTGAAAIVNLEVHVEATGRLRLWTSLKALGVLGIYVSDLENRSLEDDFMALLFGKPIPFHTVSKGNTKDVLEIDVETAWKESDQKASWSNEIAVELFIS